MPGLDTGSIRATTDNSVLSVAGLRVSVGVTPKHRMDGELLRGFGLKFDGVDEFTTTKAVTLSGIEIPASCVRADRELGALGRPVQEHDERCRRR